jgi:GNAT superfamily N-acetyltransferase
MRLTEAQSPEEIEACRRLFRAYAGGLGFNLAFQDFERELSELPGEYAPPRGRLLLATDGGAAAGCAGVRPLEPGVCELKRLYVAPDARGAGLGRRLALAAISAARELGYERMRLDTVPAMRAAHALYESLGFAEIAPYRHNPVPGTRYFELRLSG